jgi:trans-L-3-hydroxyproline dehydratase
MIQEKLTNWNPPAGFTCVKTIDMHTAGEPLRVITSGIPDIPGNTILEKRRFFRDHYDSLRTSLMWEPRGHGDMYGAILTQPVTPDGDFGTFFLHNEGYSTMCGHAMIALIKLALETGLVTREGGRPEVLIDAPPGRITGYGIREGDTIVRSFFRNVPSFVLLSGQVVQVPGIGPVEFDVAYGGAFYAFVDAAKLGFRLVPEEYGKLIDYGRRIKLAVMDQFRIIHPFEPDLSFLYGTIFTGEPMDPANHSRNVCVFANGEIDRSPTGSGVSARSALHHAKDGLPPGRKITIESIIGSTMTVEIVETTAFGNYPAVIPEVSGTSHFTGRHEFYLDATDSLTGGFFLK